MLCWISEIKTHIPSTVTYPVTNVQSEDNGQHTSGRIATVMLSPIIMNVFKKHRVHHQNLHTHTQCYHGNMLVFIGSDSFLYFRVKCFYKYLQQFDKSTNESS